MIAALDIMETIIHHGLQLMALVGVAGLAWHVGECIREIAASQRRQRESWGELRRAGR